MPTYGYLSLSKHEALICSVVPGPEANIFWYTQTATMTLFISNSYQHIFTLREKIKTAVA